MTLLVPESSVRSQPLVKWVGGKRQLLSHIVPMLMPYVNEGREYFEPFIGGGAVFFALQPKKAVISDVNRGLVNLYQQVQADPNEVWNKVKTLESAYNAAADKQDYYYRIREEFNFREGSEFRNRLGSRGAAIFLFLNKSGFNGMYRENLAGEFNIPFGNRHDLKICDFHSLERVSSSLSETTIKTQSYTMTLEQLKPRDNAVVYLDPPYAPLPNAASFEAYNSQNVNGFDQINLSSYFKNLTDKRIPTLMSNSSAPIVEDLFSGEGVTMKPVSAARLVGASIPSRNRVTELLVDNFRAVS